MASELLSGGGGAGTASLSQGYPLVSLATLDPAMRMLLSDQVKVPTQVAPVHPT